MRAIIVLLAIETITFFLNIDSPLSILAYQLTFLSNESVLLFGFVNSIVIPLLIFGLLISIIYSFYIRFNKKDKAKAKILFFYPITIIIQILFFWIIIQLHACSLALVPTINMFTGEKVMQSSSCYPPWYRFDGEQMPNRPFLKTI